MSRYNLLRGKGGEIYRSGRESSRERKKEWNANRPAVADSGRPMSDEHEAFGGMVRDGYMYPVQVMRMPVIVRK